MENFIKRNSLLYNHYLNIDLTKKTWSNLIIPSRELYNYNHQGYFDCEDNNKVEDCNKSIHSNYSAYSWSADSNSTNYSQIGIIIRQKNNKIPILSGLGVIDTKLLHQTISSVE